MSYFATDHTPVCGWRFQHAKHVTMHLVKGKFSSISEANASEEKFEKMYLKYQVDYKNLNGFVIIISRREKVKQSCCGCFISHV